MFSQIFIFIYSTSIWTEIYVVVKVKESNLIYKSNYIAIIRVFKPAEVGQESCMLF